MIRINQLKLPIREPEKKLFAEVAKILAVSVRDIQQVQIVRKSIDARKKDNLHYSYMVDVELETDLETKLLKRKKAPYEVAKKVEYIFPKEGNENLAYPPVIIGSGPAGLFCGLMLAEQGYRPVILERGEAIEERVKTVDAFWNGGELNPASNVQFGEGGAGTFSDGKLNTMVKDRLGRNRKVLETFVEFGADESLLYLGKPHIGTDVLAEVVKNIRNQIIALGGQVRFNSQVTDFVVEGDALKGLVVNGEETIPCDVAVLAIGHSARDTFEMLGNHPVEMKGKAFAVGLRILHPQEMINQSQYGEEGSKFLPAADYKLTMQTTSGRGVYSFCMCPGGYVVNASSEAGRLAVNGMSYHQRDGVCSNSALIVTVSPEDFDGQDFMAGIRFQRKLEEAAYQAGKGKIPVQLYGDFVKGEVSEGFGEVVPAFKGETCFADLRTALPEFISEALVEGIDYFERRIKGFSRKDSILAGVESRTSSPIRIERDDLFESNLKGLFPCGEGAGYAGGIMSAAMDGLKVAEGIGSRYQCYTATQNGIKMPYSIQSKKEESISE